MSGSGDTVWRYARATRAHVVVDAADYFRLAREAMMRATCRILLIGWDFDTRITLVREADGEDVPSRLGDFILWLARTRPELEIRILRWRFGTIKTLGRGSTVVDLARWAMTPQIDFKLDSAHPAGCSHHQKIVIIDDRFAVCGGIDMTAERWDTRAHRDDEPGRKRPGGKPYGPWHDCTMLLEGEAAAALGELGHDRWAAAGGAPMPPCPAGTESAWPASLKAEFQDVEIGIARTRAAHGGNKEVREIEAAFLEQIARAKHFIYAETQYFASRRIADAIAARLEEHDPPEIIIVNPLTADGWLEQKAMDAARVELLRALGEKDRLKRLNIFVPHTAGGTPIYVHAKLMIVDDVILRVGSANMNNRSMGLDSECDVFIDAKRPGNEDARDQIRALRLSLLAEHNGCSVGEVEAAIALHGSHYRAIIALSVAGRRHLKRLELPALGDIEKTLADAEALDAEHAEEIFEPLDRRGLFKRSRRLRKPR